MRAPEMLLRRKSTTFGTLLTMSCKERVFSAATVFSPLSRTVPCIRLASLVRQVVDSAEFVDHDVAQRPIRQLLDAPNEHGDDGPLRLGVEAELPSRTDKLDLAEGLQERFRVLDVAVDRVERLHDDPPVQVALVRELAGGGVIALAECLDELLVL